MQQQQNQRLDASIRDRIAELQAANQLGLDTLREFWGNPDIRLGFKAWWISISSFEERVQMITAAYNSAQIKKSDDDADEDFLQLNEQAAYRIQVMVTQELQDLSALAKLGETGDGILIDVLEALVDGRENAALLAPLQPAVKRQIDEELAADLHLLTQLSSDIKVMPPRSPHAFTWRSQSVHKTNSEQSNHLLVDAIFDRLEERFRNHHLSSVPYLLRLRIQRLAALDSSARYCPSLLARGLTSPLCRQALSLRCRVYHAAHHGVAAPHTHICTHSLLRLPHQRIHTGDHVAKGYRPHIAPRCSTAHRSHNRQ